MLSLRFTASRLSGAKLLRSRSSKTTIQPRGSLRAWNHSHTKTCMAFQSRGLLLVSATFTQRTPSPSTRSEPTGRQLWGMCPGWKLVRLRPAGWGLPLFHVA